MQSPTVADEISRLHRSGARPTYVIPPGNAGDGLISLGFFDLAERIGLEYTTCTPQNIPSTTEPVIFGGGGGLGGGWSTDYREIIWGEAKSERRVLVMPLTVVGQEEFLSDLGANVTIFAREHRSHDHLQAHATNGAQVGLDHDTAFHLDARAFLNRSPRPERPRVSRLKDAARHVLYTAAWTRALKVKHAQAFRVDREAKEVPEIKRTLRRDFSLLASFGLESREECEYTGYKLLSLIDRYAEVSTDRLHVAIGSLLLGKHVHLYDNAYFKIRAVYEMSMSSSAVEMKHFA